MPSFEEILAEAEASIARQKARRSSPSRSPIDREDDPARSLAYTPTRNIYLYNTTLCKHCGAGSTDLEGIYEDRQHTQLKHSHWVRLPAHPTTNLPRAAEYRTLEVPYCKICANPHHAQTKETQSESETPPLAEARNNSEA